jgi:leucyl/phenylalanyl-tRNA--protein transferase
MMIEPELLLDAYRHGIFPMAIGPDKGVGADKHGGLGWFSPDPRAIIPLDDRFHIPHGLRRVWKRCVVAKPAGVVAPVLGRTPKPAAETAATTPKFVVTFDEDFASAIRACAKRKEGTWISKEIIESYCNLHHLGHAHSVEVRLRPKAASSSSPRKPRLCRGEPSGQVLPPSSFPIVGGLYGIHIGGAFFGESMFHRVSDASKIALVALVERLRSRGFALLDTQWQTPHLAQFGTYEIPRAEYLRRLRRAVAIKCEF